MEQKGRAEILLEGLKTRVKDAPSAALHSEKAVLDREELLNLIDKVSEVVKNELNAYREVNDKRARILKEAKDEAEEIKKKLEEVGAAVELK